MMYTDRGKRVAKVAKNENDQALRVAVIGVGNMGKNHVRNYAEIGMANLVAISDLNEELGRTMANEYGCRYYKDHNEMLDNEQIDAVTIVVPSKYHHAVGLDVIRRGIHVLMEKPIAMTEPEAQDLIDAAKQAKVKLMVGHVERFNPVVVKLREIIEEGKLGRIVSVATKRVSPMPGKIRDANVLVDLAVHDIDIISHLYGSQPDRILANGGRAHLEDRDDHAEILLGYGDASGSVDVNWVTPVRVRKMSVTGTGGYAEVDYLEQKLTLYPSVVTKTVVDYHVLLVKFGDPQTIDVPVEKHQPLAAEITSFLQSIVDDTPVFTSGDDGLAALRVALAADADIKKGRR